MGPNRLDTLPVRQPNPVHQRNVVWNLAAGAVSHEVELGHSGAVGGKLFEVEIEWWEVTRQAALEVHAPLAGNVVCDEEASDPHIEIIGDGRREGVVCVNVSVEGLAK